MSDVSKIKSVSEIESLINQNNYQEAKKELLEVIKVKKDNYHANFLLGNVYSLLNEKTKAIEFFKKSIELNPKNKVALYNLGVNLYDLNKLIESQKILEQSLELDPNYLNANLALAVNFEKQNNFEKAKIYFKKTLFIDNDFLLGNQLYGKFLMKIGEITKAQYYNYKYSGVFSLKDKKEKKSNPQRINISDSTNFIGCWNIDDDNICDKLIKFFDNRKDLQAPGLTGSGRDEKSKKSIDIPIDPKNLNQKDFEDLKSYILKLQDCFNDYLIQWPFLKDNLNMLDIPTFNIQKYEPGGHFNLMHCERSNLQTMHRVFAWMTYLNDVDDGGQTYFEHYKLRVKPSRGKTLIWPAEWTHAHRGEVLNKGSKYIITGWMHFPFNIN